MKIIADYQEKLSSRMTAIHVELDALRCAPQTEELQNNWTMDNIHKHHLKEVELETELRMIGEFKDALRSLEAGVYEFINAHIKEKKFHLPPSLRGSWVP